MRYESPMEWALVVQAVAVAEFGPFGAAPNGYIAGSQVDDRGRNKKRRDAPRTVLQQGLVFALDHLEPADPAADVHPHLLGDFRGDLQAGILQGEIRRRDGELDEAPHLLDFFFLDVCGRVETLHFSGNPAGEGSRIELRDGANAGLPRADRLPGCFGSNAQRRQQTDARHYHSSRQNSSPCEKSGYFLGRLILDVFYGVLHGGDLFGVFVGNLQFERLFERHDEFDDIQRIGAQIVNERRVVVHLALIDAELLDNNLLHLLLNLP